MLPWLLFVNLSVLGSLVYTTCFKLSGNNINAIAYTFVLGCTHIVTLGIIMLVANYGFKINFIDNIKPRGVAFAAISGISVIVIDIGLFFAFRKGSAISTNTYTGVAGIVLFAIVSIILFGEKLTLIKGVGIALGIASLVLLAI